MVNVIFKDSKNRLWIGTEGGLAVKEGENTYYYTHHPKQNHSLPNNPILAIYEDNKNRIWVGTWAGGLSLFDEKNKQFATFKIDANNPNKLPNPNIFGIYQSSQTGQMLAISRGGGFHVLDDEKQQNFTNYTFDKNDKSSISQNYGRVIYEDRKKNIWIGTGGGLNRFDMTTKKFSRYLHSKKDSNSLNHNTIFCILEDSKARLWVGTSEGLNLMVNDKKFISYTTANGLPNNSVNSILEDSNGYLWISTNMGISKFDTETGKFRNYDESDGLQSNQLNTKSSFKAKDGQLFLGGINGLNAFYPDDIKDNPHTPTVFIKDFKIFNESVKIGEYDSLLKQVISQTQEITLTYKLSVFSFEFVGINFINAHKNQYSYILEGFEQKWNNVGIQRSATYTNLEAGAYTFRVKASNNDGIWNEEGASIKITILPPWWATWWFRSLFIALFLVCGFAFYKGKKAFLKKQKAKLEDQVNARIAEMQQIYQNQSKEANEESIILLNKLSNREKEVLDKILTEKNNKQIAEELFIELSCRN